MLPIVILILAGLLAGGLNAVAAVVLLSAIPLNLAGHSAGKCQCDCNPDRLAGLYCECLGIQKRNK